MFTDRSADVADRTPHRGYGAAVTPGVDGPCVLVTGYGDENRLLTWRDGALRDVASSAVADPGRHAIGVAAADLDADGDEELYVHNTDEFGGHTRDTDLLLDPVDGFPDADDARWRDLFGLGVNADRGNFRAGRSVAALDRYGTGRYGVFVASYGAPSRFYELGDDGELSDMASAVGLDVDACGRSLLAGPVVSDRMDLFVGVERGPNRLFRNDRGHFEDVAAAAGVDDPDGDARGVTYADGGVACGNWEGPSRLFTPDADGGPADGGRFVDAAPPAFAAPTRVRTVVAADFDNDGRDELFVHAIGAENRLFRRERPVDADASTAGAPDAADTDGASGGWTRIDAGPAAEPSGLGTGAAVADVDGDGSLELLLVHGELAAQPLTLFGADGDGDWLRIRPTTQYGAPARGAAVTLETDAWTKTRVVCAGSGYLCQMEPVAHFGLGDATPERATVRWPDGRETELSAPTPRREHEIPHPMAPRF
ncbi:ASPIC/UnbV domain-containing protein [Halobaculum sp. D14]|uniref:ASPIC/UnbV domain-containing protein n=1 Tax=Halobaculum sp. D14 TaxID=3421642 RepID=UPI003EBB4CBA